MNPQLQAAVGICIAALGGLAVGFEREWSGHASGPRARFAGIRTFTLLGLLGGVTGWMWSQGQQILPALLILGAVALVVTAYAVASQHDVDGTTEVAALVVLAAALTAGTNHWAGAGAIIAVTTLLLVEKSRIHSMVGRLDDASLQAAARFAVMAVVILPMLPTGPYGPWGGFRPRVLWMLVLFFSGLNFAGYIAHRAVGQTRGHLATGLLGGFISSTAVTLSNARESQSARDAAPLVCGALAACTVIFLRVLLATAVLNSSMLPALASYLILPVVAGTVATLVSLRHQRQVHGGRMAKSQNPLQFYSAVKMALIFQAVFYAVYGLQRLFQEAAPLVSGAAVGLVEIDALVIAMSRKASELGAETASRAIVAGLIGDASLKLVLALVAGRGRFRWWMAAGLTSIIAALLVSFIVAHRWMA